MCCAALAIVPVPATYCALFIRGRAAYHHVDERQPQVRLVLVVQHVPDVHGRSLGVRLM